MAAVSRPQTSEKSKTATARVVKVAAANSVKTSAKATKKPAATIGVLSKYYYEQSPTRGRYIDSVRVVIDEATDAIAVPYLSHVKRVE